MLSSSHSGVLNVALTTISPHNRAILEFFFAGAGKELFKIVQQPAQADVFILDYDHTGADKELEALQNSYTQPFILLSIHPLEIDNTVWVSKPLTSKSLTDAAHHANDLLGGNLAPKKVASTTTTDEPTVSFKAHEPPQPATPPAPKPSAPPILEEEEEEDDDEPANIPNPLAASVQPFGLRAQPKRKSSRRLHESAPPPTPKRMVQSESAFSVELPTPTPTELKSSVNPLVSEQPRKKASFDSVPDNVLSQEEQDARWKVLIGERQDCSRDNLQQEGGLFSSENTLLAQLKQALALANETQHSIQIRLNQNDYLLLMPKTNFSYCTMDLQSESFANLCQQMNPTHIEIHQPSLDEARGLELNALNDEKHIYDIESFIWTASLLTSQGRLDQAISPEQTYRLKSWPNLTRLEQIPHVMRIAAIWAESATNAFEVAEKLAIPQRYVFAFHCAANTLDLLVLEQVAQGKPSTTQPKKNRGLFSRLLKRLLGGGAN